MVSDSILLLQDIVFNKEFLLFILMEWNLPYLANGKSM
jgi:hypothetical protein